MSILNRLRERMGGLNPFSGYGEQTLGAETRTPPELSPLEQALATHQDTPLTRAHWAQAGEIDSGWMRDNPLEGYSYLPDLMYQNPYASYVEGREPMEDLFLDEETIELIKRNARRWAGTMATNDDQANLTHRYMATPETLQANADFVEEYLDPLLRLAPYYNLPPDIMASIAMYESGWGGQRFGGNLSGWGIPGQGDVNLGYTFGGDGTPKPEMVSQFLEAVSTEPWGSNDLTPRYEGARTAADFVAGGYNTINADWEDMVSRRIMNMLLAQ